MTDEIVRNERLDPDSGPRLQLLWPIVLVMLGGSAGAVARYLLGEAIPDIADVPVGTFVINLTGAFLLGYLIEVLARYGPDTGGRRDLRLLFGTGVLGSFTSYSALAAATTGLLSDSTLWVAAAYGLATVLFGATATLLGIALGRTLPSKRGEHA